MIPLATSGSVIAIAATWLYYNHAHQSEVSGTYVPCLAAVTAVGGLTATAIYWIAPDNERSMLGAFIGGVLTAAVAAGALIAMTITAFGS